MTATIEHPVFDRAGVHLRNVTVSRGQDHILFAPEGLPFERMLSPLAPFEPDHFVIQRVSAGDWSEDVFIQDGADLRDRHVIGNIFRWLTGGRS